MMMMMMLLLQETRLLLFLITSQRIRAVQGWPSPGFGDLLLFAKVPEDSRLV
jgi:hypothetical protein